MNTGSLWIDGGTTNTRLTLTVGEQILERCQRRIGATDASDDNQNKMLYRVVKQELIRMEATYKVQITQICIAGMITSENGLVEVPHILAPVGMSELINAICKIVIPDISPTVPIHCIAGVKTIHGATGEMDMMRGEETEIMGDLAQQQCSGTKLYLHFGSHNKAVLVREGQIVSSTTTMSGELLYAITQATILRSAVGNVNDFDMDDAYVLRGATCAQQDGLSRALFRSRLCAVLEGATKAQTLSFLFGILSQQDAMAFREYLTKDIDELILYGREDAIHSFLCCMNHSLNNLSVRTLSFEESQWLSIKGMQKMMEGKKELQNASNS